MGVDLVISGVSLGKVAVARCRPFRPRVANPVLIVERTQTTEEITIRRIFPLESLPIPVRMSDSSLITQQAGSEERFALDLTLKYWPNLEESQTFNRWLSHLEYEQAKAQYYKTRPKPEEEDQYLPMLTLSPKEWQSICQSCPLHIPVAIDCGPRLFGYGALPLLRRAAAELGTGSNRAEFERLLEALKLLFPMSGKDAAGELQAVEQDRTFQAFFSLLAGEGLELTPRYLAESPPVGRMDELVDCLFFWKGGRWVKGRQLEGLSKWLEQFMDLVNQTLLVTGISEEMKVFVEVMTTYQQAVRQADQYKLALRMSW